MKITREADYAIRIVVMLAQRNAQTEAKIIAEETDIPYRFTLKILRKIVQAGIIKSYRGVNGGYILNKEVSEITFKDIIETIDGKIAINKCFEDSDVCRNSGVCKIQKKLCEIQNHINYELENITVEDILNMQ